MRAVEREEREEREERMEFDPKMMQQVPTHYGQYVTEAKTALAELANRKGPDKLYGCTSYVSRKLNCGYNTAAAIMEDLQRDGFITDADDHGCRRLIIKPR